MPALPPVVGSYQPLLELASGGMATVYAVRQMGAQGFERVVVMKRVHPHLGDIRDFRAMFLDEARLSSLIKHPNIVPVIDVAEEAGELFLIMEYVESVSLAQLIRALAGERLSPPFVSRIVCDALAGLQAAHEAVDLRGNAMNIIHRDVSPQNIIVGADGTSRLIDFGIAKASSRLTPTSVETLKGKTGYMAPEQIRQLELDRRVDVFAAGVVLHEALTATRLFTGKDEADALLWVMVREVPDPSSLVPDLPDAIDSVVHKALARDRDERFSTAGEFAAALEAACPPVPPRDVAALVARVCSGTLIERRRKLQVAFSIPPPPPPSVSAPVAAMSAAVPASMSGGSNAGSPPGRRWRLIFGMGLVAVGLAGGALAFSLQGPHARAEPSPLPPASASGPTSQPEPTPPAEAQASSSSVAPAASPAAPSTPKTNRPVAPRPATPSRPPSRPSRPSSDLHKDPYLNP